MCKSNMLYTLLLGYVVGAAGFTRKPLETAHRGLKESSPDRLGTESRPATESLEIKPGDGTLFAATSCQGTALQQAYITAQANLAAAQANVAAAQSEADAAQSEADAAAKKFAEACAVPVSDVAALEKALVAPVSGGTLMLAAGKYTLAQTLTISTDITLAAAVDATVVLVGGGTVQTPRRVFKITGGTVQLKGLAITGGNVRASSTALHTPPR